MRTCSVVGGIACERPPDGNYGPIRTCYQCGEDVCEQCSEIVINRRKRRIRMCDSCKEVNEKDAARIAAKAGAACKPKVVQSFGATVTCDECPWRTDVKPGRFPPERFEKLRASVEQGFGKPMFACHKSPEGQEFACVGYLLSDESHQNFAVRMAYASGRIDRDKLKAKGPLYETYADMAEANGCEPAEEIEEID